MRKATNASTTVGTPSMKNIQRQAATSNGACIDSNQPDSGPPNTTETGTASMVVAIACAR